MGIHHDTYAGAGFPLFTLGNSPASLPPSLRHVVENEIERMIDWLDGLEPDADLEPSIALIGGSDDDREWDVADDRHDEIAEDGREENGDDEPWLATPEVQPGLFEKANGMFGYAKGDQTKVRHGANDDAELDDCDDEDTDHSGCGDNEAYWLEEKGEGTDLGATEELDQERSWAGPDWNEFRGHPVTDGEPSLGWANNGGGFQQRDCAARDDREDDAGDSDELPDDGEPSLGWTAAIDQRVGEAHRDDGDRELDNADCEPCPDVEGEQEDDGIAYSGAVS